MDTKLKISLSCRKPSVTFRSSVSQKWSHQIGSLGDPVSNLLKHFLHQDIPWHEGWWGNQALAIGSRSSPTVCSQRWWSIPCYLTRLGCMEEADCPDASLQRWCNHEGFNSHVTSNGFSRVRMGVNGNEQDDCSSHDSRIKSGEGGSRYENMCGNRALWSADNRDKNIKEFGYIFIQ